MPDVIFTERTEHRVANRVHQHVRVRVAIEPLGVRDFDSAQVKLSSRDQLVNVVANADMIHARGV
jgi:hypothetical protein